MARVISKDVWVRRRFEILCEEAIVLGMDREHFDEEGFLIGKARDQLFTHLGAEYQWCGERDIGARQHLQRTATGDFELVTHLMPRDGAQELNRSKVFGGGGSRHDIRSSSAIDIAPAGNNVLEGKASTSPGTPKEKKKETPSPLRRASKPLWQSLGPYHIMKVPTVDSKGTEGGYHLKRVWGVKPAQEKKDGAVKKEKRITVKKKDVVNHDNEKVEAGETWLGKADGDESVAGEDGDESLDDIDKMLLGELEPSEVKL